MAGSESTLTNRASRLRSFEVLIFVILFVLLAISLVASPFILDPHGTRAPRAETFET